jgi:hypothetical protein
MLPLSPMSISINNHLRVYYFLGHNGVQYQRNSSTFRRKILPPSSWSKNKRSKKQQANFYSTTWRHIQISLVYTEFSEESTVSNFRFSLKISTADYSETSANIYQTIRSQTSENNTFHVQDILVSAVEATIWMKWHQMSVRIFVRPSGS